MTLNEVFSSSLAEIDGPPAFSKAATTAVMDYIRRQMRRPGFFRLLCPTTLAEACWFDRPDEPQPTWLDKQKRAKGDWYREHRDRRTAVREGRSWIPWKLRPPSGVELMKRQASRLLGLVRGTRA